MVVLGVKLGIGYAHRGNTMKGQLRKPVRHILPTWVIGAIRYSLVVFLSLVAVPRSVLYSLHGQEPSVTSPSLDSILDSLEQTAEQSTARAHAYEVTREYKVFHGDEPEPISDVTAQSEFSLTPACTKNPGQVMSRGGFGSKHANPKRSANVRLDR